jgi:uncharacterized protein YxeA
MKNIIISLVSLLVGVGIGWYFGYTRPIAKVSRDAHREMPALQAAVRSDDTFAAVIALNAIPLIEAGDTQKAVKVLAYPIGNYYRFYALHAGTNQEWLQMRARIEQIASTNQVVDAEIHKKVD